MRTVVLMDDEWRNIWKTKEKWEMDHLEFFFRQFEIIEDVMMMALDIPKVSSVTTLVL